MVGRSRYLRGMRLRKWLPFLAAALLVGACFFPWVRIPGRDVVISGFQSEGSNFGKPGILQVLMTGICCLLLLVGRSWSKGTAFFLSAFNLAWAVRNYFIISACRAGICPVKQPALYMVLAAAVLFTVFIIAYLSEKEGPGVPETKS